MASIDQVNDLPPRVQYVALAAQTVFPFPFPVFTGADLDVYVDGVLKAQFTDFSVSGAGDDLGGNVTFGTPMVGGETVTIIRDIAFERNTDVSQNGPWSSAAYNDELDKVFLLLQQLKADFKRSLRIPAIAAVDDDEIELVTANFANKYVTLDANGKPTPAVLSSTTMTRAIIGQLFYPTSSAENTALVTPVNFYEEYGYVERQGAVGNGVTSDTAAIGRALSINEPVFFKAKTYMCGNLTQTHNFQRIYGFGDARLQKNANGPLMTSSGSDVEFNGIAFRGGASGADFTGDGVVMTGNNARLINCGSRYMTGRAAKCTGNHVQILGTCDIYQTTDATASGYDIELGLSGVATLYHTISDIYTSQPTGGILTTDTGSTKVMGSLFGKLTVANGTGPGGVNGGVYSSNRILGDVSVSVSNAVFSGNQFGAVAISFGAGTSGHRFDETNSLQVGATVTDLSVASHVVDSRLVPFQSFTPTFTAAGGSPAVGNGTLICQYSQVGRRVKGFIRFTIGSTTNVGTGAWTFSLPAIPNTGMPCHGTLLILDNGTGFMGGVSRTGSSGVASIQGLSGTLASPTWALVGAAYPIAVPAAGDEYHFEFDYFTN